VFWVAVIPTWREKKDLMFYDNGIPNIFHFAAHLIVDNFFAAQPFDSLFIVIKLINENISTVIYEYK
jgi:hypothetical protein